MHRYDPFRFRNDSSGEDRYGIGPMPSKSLCGSSKAEAFRRSRENLALPQPAVSKQVAKATLVDGLRAKA